MNFNKYLNYIILIFIFSSIYAFGQTKTFNKDSLISPMESQIIKNVKKIPVEILKGIVAGDYKKPGWNEYIPRDGLTLTDLPLITNNMHPRMITESQLLSVKNKLNRLPFLNWYNWLVREATIDNIHNNSPMYRVADKLKILAFLYRISEDRKFLIRIKKYLSYIPEPPVSLTFQGGKRGKGWGDFLESAQSLTSLCVAVDLIYDDIDELLRKNTIRKMLLVTDQLLNAMIVTPANNHVIVIAISIMQMAMLEDNPNEYISYNQQQLWQKGLWHLSRGLGRIAPDGGYAESVYYGRFVVSYLAAMSVHFENMTGIRLFDHIYLERMVNWIISNDKGSGYFSAFDDEIQPEYFIFPIIMPGSNQAGYWYNYWKTKPDYRKVHPNMVEGLCVYREGVISDSYIPDKIQFFPDLGQAVFRDKSIDPRIFGSFMAERERWFSDRHEHIDPLTFEISAYGEDIIVEGGYGFGISDYYRSSWYTSPYAHNGILVDGVGTYSNPVWGDSTGSSIHHAFSTENNASATLRHKIQDVEIDRKIYFLNARFFLMIDKLKGNRRHSIALNFNHKGNFKQLSKNTFNINVNNSSLDIAHLNSEKNRSIITHNYGRLTPPLPAKPIRSFQIEQTNVKNGYFATLLLPKSEKDVNFSITNLPVIGDGEVQKISILNKKFSEHQWAINRGGLLKAGGWQSDARVLYLQSDPTGALQSLLLIDFTHFNEHGYAIESDRPITLFLEHWEGQWLGYIESDLETKLKMSGFPMQPVRLNHHLIQSQIVSDSSGLSYSIFVPSSGSLELGAGRSRVKVAYRFHNHPNLLVWLKNRPHQLKNYNSWTDYKKQVFQNQIVSNMFVGINQVSQNWSETIFRNPDVLTMTVNATGMLQETFSDATNSSYDIAHRYRFDGKFGNSNWEFLEDGTLTEQGILLRNLSFRTIDRKGSGINYRFNSWIEDHASHYVRLNSDYNNFLIYQNSQNFESNQQQIQFNFDNSFYSFNQGIIWNDKEDFRQIFINGGFGNYNTSIWHAVSDESVDSYESVSGYSENYAFTLEGEQQGKKLHQYRGQVLYFLSDNLQIKQGLNFRNVSYWTLPYSNTELNWRFSRNVLRAGLLKRKTDYFQQLAFFSNFNNSYLSTHINLDNFSFTKESNLQIEGNFRFDSDYQYYSNVLYYFNKWENKFEMDIYQNLWVPVSLSAYIHPNIGLNFPKNDPFKSIGVGLTNYNIYPIFAQIILVRNRYPVIVDYQFSIQNINLIQKSSLQFWMHFQQSGDQLNKSEFRIQNASYHWQPGIYYLYDRNLGSRWEGYLEWYW